MIVRLEPLKRRIDLELHDGRQVGKVYETIPVVIAEDYAFLGYPDNTQGMYRPHLSQQPITEADIGSF